jgi:hypothetical protein
MENLRSDAMGGIAIAVVGGRAYSGRVQTPFGLAPGLDPNVVIRHFAKALARVLDPRRVQGRPQGRHCRVKSVPGWNCSAANAVGAAVPMEIQRHVRGLLASLYVFEQVYMITMVQACVRRSKRWIRP